MIDTLRIIHLDDDIFSTSLVKTLLAEEGFVCDIERVETEGDFIDLLERGEFDLVLADLTLPAMSGMAALAMSRERYPGLPFIFVTDTMGEEVAIESLKSGATDYVLKCRLSRLGPAVKRALRGAEELRHTQKLEAIGHQTGGIAHDINNFLTVIMGHASILIMKFPDNSALSNHLQQIHMATNSASSLTKSLFTFSRKQPTEMRASNLNDIVTKVERMISALVRKNVECMFHLAVKVLPVMVDAGQIEQVLMNLLANARNAMPHGGEINISTGITEIDREFVEVHGFGEPGQYARLTVSDNGIGMDEETRNKIFEPFFTTKKVGEGTGLGLSMAYGIIKQHKGFINCYSEPGRGTTFSIYLPLSGIPTQ